jgi:hypothetical protein
MQRSRNERSKKVKEQSRTEKDVRGFKRKVENEKVEYK